MRGHRPVDAYINETAREVVAERVAVAADVDPRLFRLPAAVHRRLRLESRVDAEVVQHPVGLQREQIVQVALLRVEERAVQETHVAKRTERQLRHGGIEATLNVAAPLKTSALTSESNSRLVIS